MILFGPLIVQKKIIQYPAGTPKKESQMIRKKIRRGYFKRVWIDKFWRSVWMSLNETEIVWMCRHKYQTNQKRVKKYT